MARTCCENVSYNVTKFLLFSYSCVFWLIGGFILAIGIYAEVERQSYRTMDSVFLAPAVILILLGIVMFIVSFIGILGSLRDNINLMKAFMIILAVCLILELVGGALAIAFRNQTKDLMSKNFKSGIKNYYDDRDLKDIMDYIQKKFKCCGGDSYKDWEKNMYHNCTAPGLLACGVPYTCCDIKINDVPNSFCGLEVLKVEKPESLMDRINIMGCTHALYGWLKDNFLKMAIFLFVIFLLQFLGLLFSVLHIQQVRNAIEDFGNYMDKSEEQEILLKKRGRVSKWFKCMPEV